MSGLLSEVQYGKVKYAYDGPTGLHETANGQAHATTCAYDNDNRVTGMTFDGGNALGYTYDALGRVATRTASPLSTTYGYVGGGYGTGSTTPLVASIQQNAIPFAYTYDSRGNILSETRSGQTTTYGYDALGQLTRVNDPHENATWVYTYDRGGNMTSKVRYAYTTGTPSGGQTTSFTYDSAWKDRLTASGQYPLTYDAIGNLKSYGGWTFEWEAGRQLKRQTQNATVVTYDYDHNGMRVRKTVANTSGYVYTTYNYTWRGNQLAHMTKGSDVLHFFYDAQNRPAKVSYNGTIYTYVHNLQGDIVGILDANGTVVVEYRYNAWGTQLSRTGELANTLGYANPFRYRGYIYDDETWMYWLRSRYYYPELHRFINADVFLGSIGSMLAHNAFAYCYNKPAVFKDANGKFPKGSFRFDWAGVKILLWYLYGKGKKRTVHGGAWTDYMKGAKLCSSCCDYEESTSLSEYTRTLLLPHGEGIVEGETRTVELSERVSLQNGESIYGYNYLHGVNMDVGGYVISATITRYCGFVSYRATCTWNDVMDPNFKYGSDIEKANFAKKIPFADPTDYTISITWEDVFVENLSGVSVPQY